MHRLPLIGLAPFENERPGGFRARKQFHHIACRFEADRILGYGNARLAGRVGQVVEAQEASVAAIALQRHQAGGERHRVGPGAALLGGAHCRVAIAFGGVWVEHAVAILQGFGVGVENRLFRMGRVPLAHGRHLGGDVFRLANAIGEKIDAPSGDRQHFGDRLGKIAVGCHADENRRIDGFHRLRIAHAFAGVFLGLHPAESLVVEFPVFDAERLGMAVLGAQPTLRMALRGVAIGHPIRGQPNALVRVVESGRVESVALPEVSGFFRMEDVGAEHRFAANRFA
ncbi:MAG: hypothetical protein BWZ10_00615 [candidate division BRC1 bacterium ADurb.BinA364]|nr:MAG: hypothetical protein BWZ10_00615 [candidate division BRC1 bacterium ADurb.BinA364]